MIQERPSLMVAALSKEEIKITTALMGFLLVIKDGVEVSGDNA
jgi:hypothetical protein